MDIFLSPREKIIAISLILPEKIRKMLGDARLETHTGGQATNPVQRYAQNAITRVVVILQVRDL